MTFTKILLSFIFLAIEAIAALIVLPIILLSEAFKKRR